MESSYSVVFFFLVTDVQNGLSSQVIDHDHLVCKIVFCVVLMFMVLLIYRVYDSKYFACMTGSVQDTDHG